MLRLQPDDRGIFQTLLPAGGEGDDQLGTDVKRALPLYSNVVTVLKSSQWKQRPCNRGLTKALGMEVKVGTTERCGFCQRMVLNPSSILQSLGGRLKILTPPPHPGEPY